MCGVTGVDVEARRQIVEEIIEDDSTTHEQWLDVVHACQVYGYHDCAMDILTCVTEMFSNEHIATRDNPTRYPPIDDRRYRPISPPSDNDGHSVEVEDSTWPRRQNSDHPVVLPPVKPASLPSLQLSDSGRQYHKKRRRKGWANSSTISTFCP